MINLNYTENSLYSTSPEAFSLFEKSTWGEKKSNKIVYTSFEALFLLENEKALAFSGKRALSFQLLLQKLRKKDKKIELKYNVFCDLRKRGYVVKTALKYGAEFRVYDKGVKPGLDHARWILYASKEHDALKWHELTAKIRIAHSTKKNLLIALVDEEEDISYYEVSWIRP